MNEKGGLWSCDVCGAFGTWGRDWEHYGSIRIQEDCGCLVATCSEACRGNPRAAELIAQFEKDHPKWGRKCLRK